MNTFDGLQVALIAAGAGQIGIAVINLFLVRLMRWEEDLARMSLLVREVFWIHGWFISAMLTLFGILTLRFAAEMSAGENPVLQWLAGAIGIFWALRAVLQVTHYSPSHWRGQPGRTLIHILILIIYPGFALAYGLAAWG